MNKNSCGYWVEHLALTEAQIDQLIELRSVFKVYSMDFEQPGMLLVRFFPNTLENILVVCVPAEIALKIRDLLRPAELS